MRRADIPLVTIDGRHAGELLAHPCACGRLMCTLGTHIWESTRDMKQNGVKAQSYEPSAGGSTDDDPDELAGNVTDVSHLEYRGVIANYWRASDAVIKAIERHRPDRWLALPEPASDEDWCSNHLKNGGTCEPRDPRGQTDLCRWCYDLKSAYGEVPDSQFMRARHEHGYATARDLAEWRARSPKRKKRKAKAG